MRNKEHGNSWVQTVVVPAAPKYMESNVRVNADKLLEIEKKAFGSHYISSDEYRKIIDNLIFEIKSCWADLENSQSLIKRMCRNTDTEKHAEQSVLREKFIMSLLPVFAKEMKSCSENEQTYLAQRVIDMADTAIKVMNENAKT